MVSRRWASSVGHHLLPIFTTTLPNDEDAV